MRILLSNDDGIHAPGIQTLAKALREFAEVQIVAPDRNRSGASNSLTLESSLRTFTFDNGDIAVQMGTPTDCVYLGVNALMRPRPDIVVSGIKRLSALRYRRCGHLLYSARFKPRAAAHRAHSQYQRAGSAS